MNLTGGWDGTVDSFLWSKDGKKVYFTAAVDGTKQLFSEFSWDDKKSQSVCNR
jgi:hypothetical protein